MARKLTIVEDNPYVVAYAALEDEDRKRDFRDEMCLEFRWTKATFYNRINSGQLSPAEAKEFNRLIFLYGRKY